jgi:hypothetical protein
MFSSSSPWSWPNVPRPVIAICRPPAETVTDIATL